MTSTINASTTAGIVITPDTSGVLALQTAGTTAVTVDASQNVGIGTASPSYKLDVSATSFIAANISTSYSGAGNIRIADASTTSASAPYIGSVGNNLTFGRLGTAEYARIDSSGNVGIGTTLGNNKLQVLLSGTDNTAGDSISSAIASFTGPNYAIGAALNPANLQVMSNSTLGADVGASIGLGGRYSTTQFAQFALIKGAKENATTGQYGTYLAFGTRANGTDISEKMRIGSSGNVGIGAVNASDVRLLVRGVDATATNYALAVENSSAASLFYLRNDKYFNSAAIANYSVAGTALVIDGSNFVGKTTSSLRYKKDIVDYDKGLDAIAKLRPVYYKSAVEGPNGIDPKQHAGFIAEEIADEGFEEFLVRNNEGEPDAIQYAQMTALLCKAIKEQQALITQLQADVAALKGATP
jgi:hypothetical protein